MSFDSYADAFKGAELVDWTRAWIIKPDRSLGTILDDFVEADFNVLAFHQGYATIKMHVTARPCTLTYQGATALEDEFENYGIRFYYRDPGDGSAKVFEGLCGPRQLSWSGNQSGAFITVTFTDLLREILRRRQVFTSVGGRYEYTETPDNIMRNMIAAQLESGSVVTPTNYDSNGDRTRFGPSTDPWTVTVENEKVTGDHPETMTYRVDHGTNLNECVVEMCMGQVPSTGTDLELWPEITETSAKNFNITVKYGRTGGGRTIGSDLASSGVVFSPDRDTLEAFDKSTDTENRANNIGIRGKYGSVSNYEFYLTDTTSQNKVGCIEDSWRAPEAENLDELQWEARLYLRSIANGTQTYEAVVREGPGVVFGRDVNVGDTVWIHSGEESFGIAEQKDLLGVRIHFPAPGWPKVTYKLGAFKRNPLADRARHGGGGGRSGGGGRPRKKTGDDACWSYRTIYDDDCADVTADECGDELRFYGERDINPNSVVYGVFAANDTAGGDACGGADSIQLSIWGIYQESAVAADGLVAMNDPNLGTVYLLAQTWPPVPPGPGP